MTTTTTKIMSTIIYATRTQRVLLAVKKVPNIEEYNFVHFPLRLLDPKQVIVVLYLQGVQLYGTVCTQDSLYIFPLQVQSIFNVDTILLLLVSIYIFLFTFLICSLYLCNTWLYTGHDLFLFFSFFLLFYFFLTFLIIKIALFEN